MIQELNREHSITVSHQMARKLYPQLPNLFLFAFDHPSDLQFAQIFNGGREMLQNKRTLYLLEKNLDAKFVAKSILS